MPTFEIPATYVETSVLVPNPSWWTSGLAWVVLSSGIVTVLGSNLAPNGYSVSLDGSAPPSPSPGATSSLHVTAPDGLPASLGYADVQYFPTGIWHERWGSAYGGLDVSATATRDEGYGVTLAITAGAFCPDPPRLQADVAVDHFHIDWGDGTSEDVNPASSAFSGIGGNTSYSATATASHTYAGAGSSTGITISAVQGEDYPQDGATPNIPPRAKFSYTIRDLTVFLNALESDDIDGTIADYDWNYHSPGTETGTPPIYPTFAYNRPHSTINRITLTVTDDDGATDSYSETFQLYLRSVSTMDRYGRIYATAPDSGGVLTYPIRQYYDPSSMANFEETLHPLGYPVALWLNENEQLFVLLGDGVFEEIGSTTTSPFYWIDRPANDGESWLEEVIYLPMFDGYLGVHGCALLPAGHALVGVDPVSNKIKCAISYDRDAEHWEEVSEVADFPGGTSAQCFIYQQNMAGSAQLVVIHPSSGMRWTSDNFGETQPWPAAT